MSETLSPTTPTPITTNEATGAAPSNTVAAPAGSPSADPAIAAMMAEKLSKIEPSNYALTDVSYGFRAETEEKIGSDGKVTKTKLPKRANVNLAMPFVTDAGLIMGISEGENSVKIRSWVISLVNDAIVAQGREQVNGDESKPGINFQSELDVSKLTMEYIALLPKSERGGAGIAKETWKEFGEDYALVMIAQSISEKSVGMAVDILCKKLVPVKTNKKALTKLANYINVWFANSTRSEEFQTVYEYLKGKAQQYIEADDPDLAEAL